MFNTNKLLVMGIYERMKRKNAENHAFRVRVMDWLDPDRTRGFIYVHNHPSPTRDVIHYTSGRMRICCEKDEYGQEFCFLLHEFWAIKTGKSYAVKSTRFNIGTDLTEHIEQMNILIDSLPRVIPKQKFRISFICKWYDGWVGYFWDKDRKWLYLLPIPCIGIVLKFR